MKDSTQIGWYNLKEDRIFRNTYECAAWYEDVLVKAGKYPMVVYDYRVRKSNNPNYNNEIEGHIGSVYIQMNGTVFYDEFGARFCGVPVGGYDNTQNVGKPSSHNMQVYMYIVADSIINDNESPFELFPEYEAKVIQTKYFGISINTYGIYMKDS